MEGCGRALQIRELKDIVLTSTYDRDMDFANPLIGLLKPLAIYQGNPGCKFGFPGYFGVFSSYFRGIRDIIMVKMV